MLHELVEGVPLGVSLADSLPFCGVVCMHMPSRNANLCLSYPWLELQMIQSPLLMRRFCRVILPNGGSTTTLVVTREVDVVGVVIIQTIRTTAISILLLFKSLYTFMFT